MAPTARAVRLRLEATEFPHARRQPTALHEDLLEEIFLQIASPTDLVRTSTTCASFRHLITDQSFLRRYRSLHPPLFLGFVHHTGLFVAAQAPHPNALAANAFAQAARAGFSFNKYLPLPAAGGSDDGFFATPETATSFSAVSL
ncbi:hypothetical protein PR202_gb21168 [Eleusine coracana subsp. coracana]|uniref:F-box domain-containing protein n=1 Tax=Eleusine coracana subsp. coracana TaxID=191504 RepID=A0AAV5FAH3_ELECO|nr:hypothetical protein PR202_gb21168 [Eleusine coracana subsp. coracana]